MINALSIDLEFWYSGEPYSNHLPTIVEEQVEMSVPPLLTLLDKYETHATFFVLGKVAKSYPSLIQTIHEHGHEISSHGYSHKKLCMLNKNSFEKELEKSVNLLTSITKERPIGFRAPSFSMDNSTKWAFESLVKYGFKYDSSVFPIKTRLYGVPNAPLGPYRPSMEDITKIDENFELVEFPLSAIKCIKTISIAGGYYFRILPFWFLIKGFKIVNKERPVVFYLHPWETYQGTPQLKIPFPSSFFAYYGIRSALGKFEKLLQKFNFAPIKEVLKL